MEKEGTFRQIILGLVERAKKAPEDRKKERRRREEVSSHLYRKARDILEEYGEIKPFTPEKDIFYFVTPKIEPNLFLMQMISRRPNGQFETDSLDLVWQGEELLCLYEIKKEDVLGPEGPLSGSGFRLLERILEQMKKGYETEGIIPKNKNHYPSFFLVEM